MRNKPTVILILIVLLLPVVINYFKKEEKGLLVNEGEASKNILVLKNIPIPKYYYWIDGVPYDSKTLIYDTSSGYNIGIGYQAMYPLDSTYHYPGWNNYPRREKE